MAPKKLLANSSHTFEGWKPQGMGFILTSQQALALIDADERNTEVVMPYINGEDVTERFDLSPSRWIINFYDWPLEKAATYSACFGILTRDVKPEREKSNRKQHRVRWWQYGETRPGLRAALTSVERVIVIPRVSKAMVPVFLPKGIVYSEALVVFAFDDPFHLGVLSSAFHWHWAVRYASTMRNDLRYTPTDCYGTFPLPPFTADIERAGTALDGLRAAIRCEVREGITKIYNKVHDRDWSSTSISALRELHQELDGAVAIAYGWSDIDLDYGFHSTPHGVRWTIGPEARAEVLDRLLEENHRRYAAEQSVGPVARSPGRPRPAKAAAAPVGQGTLDWGTTGANQ